MVSKLFITLLSKLAAVQVSLLMVVIFREDFLNEYKRYTVNIYCSLLLIKWVEPRQNLYIHITKLLVIASSIDSLVRGYHQEFN